MKGEQLARALQARPDAATFIVSEVRKAVSLSGRKALSRIPMDLSVETWDFGNQVGVALGAYLAQWPDRGEPLTVSWPATWWQHLKQAVYRRFSPVIGYDDEDDLIEAVLAEPRKRLANRVGRRLATWAEHRWPVRMQSQTYRARHYLPAVKLPPRMREGEFFVWDGNWNTKIEEG